MGEGSRAKGTHNKLLDGLFREGLGEVCPDLGVVDLWVVDVTCALQEDVADERDSGSPRACAVCVCRRVSFAQAV